MYPDRDVRRNTQFAGFMIILFWRPFPTPSGSLYPWNINWDGAALNLVPALIPVIHYYLTSFFFFLQQPFLRCARARRRIPPVPTGGKTLVPAELRCSGLKRSGWPGERLTAERLGPDFALFFYKKAGEKVGSTANWITPQTSTAVM